MEIFVSPLKTFPNGKGFGFNVALILEGQTLQFNGFRVYKTGFTPPSIMYGKGHYYAAALLTKEIALRIVKNVLEANPELEAYLNPGLTLEFAVQGLLLDNSTLGKFSIPLTVEEKE